MRPLVLKIGGSLSGSGRLAEALVRAAASPRPVVVVPGGGPFAEAVRKAQEKEGFSDAVAHRMAILAMHQMAEIMMDLQPKLRPAETLTTVHKGLRSGHAMLWLPYRLATADTSLPQDWSITSDGLAARLAERLGRCPVALLKSCRVPDGASPRELAKAGIVDPVFAAIVARADLEWHVLGTGEAARYQALLRMPPAKHGKRR